MKTFLLAVVLFSNISSAGNARLVISFVENAQKISGNLTKNIDGGGSVRVGNAVVSMAYPEALRLDYRPVLERTGRDGLDLSWHHASHLMISINKSEKESILNAVPQGNGSRLALVMEGQVLGITPVICDWDKNELSFRIHKDDPAESFAVAALKSKGIKVACPEEQRLEMPQNVWPAMVSCKVFEGIGQLIKKQAVKLPLRIQGAHERHVLMGEPVEISLNFSFPGIDRSELEFPDFPVPDQKSRNLRIIPDAVIAVTERGIIPKWKTEESVLGLGMSVQRQWNFSRELGCRYSAEGLGHIRLEYQLQGGRLSEVADPWLEFYKGEVYVHPWEKNNFQAAISSDAEPGLVVSVGSYRLMKDDLTLLVMDNQKTPRVILRMETKPGIQTWHLAWDSVSKKTHILGIGARSWYWVTASDQLGFDVRVEVPSSSKLELKNGSVRRVE